MRTGVGSVCFFVTLVLNMEKGGRLCDSLTDIAIGRVHAARQSPYRSLALSWRVAGCEFQFPHLKRFAQTLERGRFDAFFMADHLAVLNMPIEGLKRSATVTSFDPLTLLPALAVVTAHLGLIATASTDLQ